jgi:hypothetical protein
VLIDWVGARGMEGPGGVRFVKKRTADGKDGSGPRAVNDALKHANKALRSEAAMVDGRLLADFESVLSGNAIYLPYFHCHAKDFTLLAELARDMELEAENGGMVNWSKHLKHENPAFSATFQKIVDDMADYFDVEVYATRMNFYRDGSDWKPFHHDSHAYGGRAQREDFTMGASFGGSRELIFLHEPSGNTFTFPQNNGDVFAFTSEVNKRFKHGVPKARANNDPRFSIIAWGRRRSINNRNGGGEVTESRERVEPVHTETAHKAIPVHFEEGKPQNELVMGTGEVSQLIKKFFENQQKDVPDKKRSLVKGNAPNRGKAPETSSKLALEVIHLIGENAYMELRTVARQYQEGHVSVKSLYSRAYSLCDGNIDILLRLVAFLPDKSRRDEILRYHGAAQVADL